MLDKLYLKLEAGTTQKNHVFIVKNDGDKIVMDAEMVDDQDLLKRGQKAGLPERHEYLSQSYLEQCAHPGLREIKQVKLYTKWCKVVPSQYQHIICPKPSDDVLGRVKADRTVNVKQRTGAGEKKQHKSAQEKDNDLNKRVTEQANKKQYKVQAKAVKDTAAARMEQDKTHKAEKKKSS
jgi:hypothetical protein